MNVGATILSALKRFERMACGVAFLVMAAPLMADVARRLIVGSGILGAPQVAVVGMIAVAMFGIGVAADEGAHLRPRFLDGVFPKRWKPTIETIAHALTALFFAGLALIAFAVVDETRRLEDVNSVLRWPLWPVQAIIFLAFLLNAVRYAIYAVSPELRPIEEADRVPEALEEARA
ncbi:MAG: TRAP transporter small permease [Pseudomonadota bacterium]